MTGEPAAPAETLPDDPSKELRAKAYRDVFAESKSRTDAIVNEEIEKQKNFIRSGGDGGFLGMIMGFIFQLAEMLHLEGFLANMVGKPIPEQAEKELFSGQVAESVSQTLVSKDFGSAEKTAEAVSAATLDSLNSLKTNGQIPSFTQDHINLAATQAGQNAAAQYAKIHQLHATLNPKTVEVTRGATKEQTVQNTLEAILKGDSFKDMDETTKKQVLETGSKFILAKEDLVKQAKTDNGKFNQLVGELTDSLLANPDIKDKLKAQIAAQGLGTEGDELKTNTAMLLAPVLNGYRPAFADALSGAPAKAGEATPPLTVPEVDFTPVVRKQIIDNYNKASEQDKKQYAALAGKESLDKADIEAIADILAPKMAELQKQKAELKKQGDKAYDTVADQLRDTLVAYKGELASKHGMKFKDNATDLALIADRLAVPATNNFLDKKLPPEQVATTMPDAFKTRMDNDTKAYAQTALADKVAEQIKAVTVAEWQKRYPDPKASADKTYQTAVKWYATLNDAQRKEVGKLVATAALETKDANNNPATFGDDLQKAIKQKLNDNIAGIDALSAKNDWLGLARGNKIANINYNLSEWGTRTGFGGKEGDILGTIAKTVADNVRANKDGAYEQLRLAQGSPVPTAEQLAAQARQNGTLATQNLNPTEAGRVPPEQSQPTPAGERQVVATSTARAGK